jgi:broad specificity phosphatase PhoE
MTRIYMVRHGQADSAWHESPDPGLSELGRQQAATAAQQLHHLNNVHIISSPLLRCQQTAQPFAQAKQTPISIHSEVSEIPTPSNIAFDQRGPWLQQAMAGTWQQLGQQFVDYQNTIAHFVANLKHDTVIFSHFIAINAVLGHVINNPQLVVAHLDNCSITTFHIGPNNVLTLDDTGNEATTTVG